MNSWFRFYHEALDDPKVQKLSGDDFKHWVNCLCLAARNGGVLPSIHDVSFAFRVTPEFASEIITNLTNVGLLDRFKSGVIHPHNWDSRQFKSDSSTERVKRYRKRSRNVPETLVVTDQNRTEQNRSPIVPKVHRNGNGLYSDDFTQFWNAYPKAVGKGDAWKSWLKIAKPVPVVGDMVDALLRQKQTAQWLKDGGQFIPNPATWINQRRWEDRQQELLTKRMPDKPVGVC